MNRLERHFKELQSKNEKALILFLTAGDPTLKDTLEIMTALAENGADCIEIGIPFSDPIADGPVIQRATARALKNNILLDDILELIGKFRLRHNTPIVCMGYLNPIIRYDQEAFCRAFRQAGGDGLIIADLPYEEGEQLETICRANGVNLIYLLAPEPGSERTRKILDASSGFVYCVSHYGTTGAGQGPEQGLREIVRSLKAMTPLPVAVGFGISSPERAAQVSEFADGVIIGSWLIQVLEKAGEDRGKAAAQFAREVKSAMS